MTTKLKEAVKEAEKLPASEQDRIAADLLERVKEMRDTFDQAFTRLSEERFAADWDNDKDAAYDNWREHYGVQ